MITLEISSTDIRVMEVDEGKVVKWASQSLEPGMFEEEVITDPRALGAAVRQLMTSSGIKEQQVTASVSGLYSLSRIITVPTATDQSATGEAVLEAAAEVMPLSEEELYFSWQAITPSEDRQQQVLVVGVPRDVIDSEVLALRAAGINPRLLDLKALALARAVNREQAVILNIDATSFDVIIVANGIVEVLRTTAWQPENLSVEERAEHLASALVLTESFHNSRHPGYPLDPATPLFITGQMSGETALTEQLQGKVAYPVEPFKPALEYPEHLPISQYAVNAGLALKAAASPKIKIGFRLKRTETTRHEEQSDYSIPDINLLPQAYRPWKPSTKQVYSALAAVIILALLFPAYETTTAVMAETASLERKYDAINNALDMRKAELTKREPLHMAIRGYDSIVALGGGLVEELEAIRSLAAELGVEVGAISHSGGGITFSCQAVSRIVFIEFITALQDNELFATPVIPPTGYPWVTGGSIKITPESAKTAD